MALDVVTTNSLLEKFQLTDEDCDKQVSDRHLAELSRTHCRNWRQLPPYLYMASIVEHDIDCDSRGERKKREDFFKEWKEMKGSDATYKALIGALLKIGSRNDAEYVCQLLMRPSSYRPALAAPHHPSPVVLDDKRNITPCAKCQAIAPVLVLALALALVLATNFLTPMPTPDEVERKSQVLTEPLPKPEVERKSQVLTEPIPKPEVERKSQVLTEPIPKPEVERKSQVLTEPMPKPEVERKSQVLTEPMPKPEVERTLDKSQIPTESPSLSRGSSPPPSTTSPVPSPSASPSPSHLQCHIEGKLDLSSVPIEEELNVNLNFRSPKEGKPNEVVAQLHCYHENSSESVSVKEIANDKYSLSITPWQRGKHELHIKYNGVHICGSPIPLFVEPPLHNLERISSKKINKVVGIKFHEGKLILTQLKQTINIIDPFTLCVKTTLTVPGVLIALIDSPHIYATDVTKHRLIKMDMNGNIIASTGTKGDGFGQFNFPNGFRLGKVNEVYVCDTNNHRIQVFDKDLNFIRALGREGSANGHFKSPDDIDIDEDGNIYVTDSGNNRIQVLTPDGQHIRNIGRPGSNEEELSNPISLEIHRGMVYVTEDGNHRVSVFKTTGEFVTTFGERTLFDLECIAVDDNGFVYVSIRRSEIVKLIKMSVNLLINS